MLSQISPYSVMPPQKRPRTMLHGGYEKKRKQLGLYEPEWLRTVLSPFMIRELSQIVMEYFFSLPHIQGHCIKQQSICLSSDGMRATCFQIAHLDQFLYVLDWANKSVKIYDKDLKIHGIWADMGRDIETDDKHIFIGTPNSQFKVLAPSGKIVTSWNAPRYDAFVICGDEMISSDTYLFTNYFRVHNKISGVKIREWKSESALVCGLYESIDHSVLLARSLLGNKVEMINIKDRVKLREIQIESPLTVAVHQNDVFIASELNIQVFDLESCQFLYQWTVEDVPIGLIFFNNHLIVSDESGNLSMFE